MAAKIPLRALSDVWKDTNLDASIHILPGTNTDLTVSDGIYVTDSFTNGPCDVGAGRQLVKRAAYWQSVQLLEMPERSSGTRRRISKINESAGRPIMWTTGSGSSRKCDDADEICLALTRFPESKPVVIWTTRHWPDRLALWWCLENIHRMQLDVSRFTVATAQSQFASDDPQSADPFSIACVPAARLRTAFDDRIPLTSQFLESGSSLWRKFADSSPLAFDQARCNGCAEFPELHSAAEAYGWLFPRVGTDNSVIQLSRFDKAFLGGFSVSEWLTPWEVLCVSQWAQALLNERIAKDDEVSCSAASGRSSSWETIVAGARSDVGLLRALAEERVASQQIDLITPICDQFGSMPFTLRLHEWAMHRLGDPLLESCPGTADTNPFTRMRYRLRPRARRLLDDGLLAPDDAPPMFAGGCEVYRRESFWVRCESTDDWWLERR